jgi:hypothetical protein
VVLICSDEVDGGSGGDPDEDDGKGDSPLRSSTEDNGSAVCNDSRLFVFGDRGGMRRGALGGRGDCPDGDRAS